MKNKKNGCKINVARAKNTLEKYMKRYDHCTITTQTAYLYDILNFFSHLEQNYENSASHIFLDEIRLIDWIKSVATNIGTPRLSSILQTVGCFMEELLVKGLISSNPMGLFKCRFGKNGWTGIARSFKSIDPQASLDSVRIQPKFTGRFGKHAKAYLEFRRSVGNKDRCKEFALISFNRFLSSKSIDSANAVTSELVQEWIVNLQCTQRSRRRRAFILKRFYDYLISLGYVKYNPVIEEIMNDVGMPSRPFTPYIFSAEQIRGILEEAKNLPKVTWLPLRAQIIYTVIAILYTLGLRISEALNIRIGNIDFQQNTIFIPQTKFYKQRLLPFGPKLGKCLKDYVELRYKTHSNVNKKDYLFVNINNIPVTDVCVRDNFKQLMKSSGMTEALERSKPRLHDLRHSFAVHRLYRWYREGVDVQNRLVLLSTFMGHFNIKSTQVYLTITDDILKQASKRYYKKFGAFIGREVHNEK